MSENQQWASIVKERFRQEGLFQVKKIPFTCASPHASNADKMVVLAEEVGEVARAIHDMEGLSRLREELVQVAAVCVAWLEALDRETDRRSGNSG